MTDKPRLADARRVTEAATDAPWFRRYVDEARTLVPALLAAVDAVLAVHVPCNVGGKQLCEYCTATGDPFCTPDGADEWPCPTVRAIAAHLDIEEQR